MFSNKLRLFAFGMTVTIVVVIILLFSRHTYFYTDPDLEISLDPEPTSRAITPVPTYANPLIERQIERGGMQYVITVPQTRYSLEDQIIVRLQAVNTSSDIISRYMNCHTDFQYFIRSAAAESELVTQFSSDRLHNRVPGTHPGACTKPIDTLIPIQPGEKIEEQLVFLPFVHTYDPVANTTLEARAPGGNYLLDIYMQKQGERILIDSIPLQIETDADMDS